MPDTSSPVSHLGAIGFALAGFTFWVFADTSIKLVGQSGLPAYEVVAFLGLFMAMFLGGYALACGTARDLRPHRFELQLVRACLDLGNNIGVVIALRHLSLTLFYIFVFMAPMVIALLSAIFLREGLRWRKAAAIMAGFAGVVIAVNPWGSARYADWTGILACTGCVACFSTNMVWSRVLTRTETPISLAFFSGLVTAAAGFALMLFHAAPLTQGKGHVLPDTERVEESAVLKDHGDAFAHSLHSLFTESVDLFAVDANGTHLRFEKAHQDAQRYRFSHAASAQDAESLSTVDGEAYVVQNLPVPK